MIEAERVQTLAGEVTVIDTPSNSGKGQKISRCPTCGIAVWSTYAGAGETIHFVRVGTLDEPWRLPPDIHIFTASKQPWVVLPARHSRRGRVLPSLRALARRQSAAPCRAAGEIPAATLAQTQPTEADVFGIHDLWLFVLSGLLLNITPGPDTLYIVGRSSTLGWRAGAVAALGIGTGALVHICAAAVGLSAILAASATALPLPPSSTPAPPISSTSASH